MAGVIRAAALLALFLALQPAGGQEGNPVAESQLHLREATAAWRNGDLRAAVTAFETALALNPSSLYARYNLACAYARTNQPEKALALLSDLVARRVDFGMADDPDLESLRGNPRFAALVEQLAEGTQPLVNSEEYFQFDQLGLAPEGIAADAETGRLFFGSMRTGEIYVIDRQRRLSRFAAIEPAHGMAAIGMTVDRSRGLLWVVGTTFDLAEHFDPDAADAGGLFGFDLDSGRLDRQYVIPGAGFNDVTVAPDRSVYVSGSAVHVLDDERDALLPLPVSAPVFGGNGLTVDDSGRTLFVSAYPVGLVAIDLATGDTRRVEEPDDVTLYGIDGLYWYDGTLVAVQNGARPWRLLRLGVDAAHAAITNVAVLEIANEATTPMTAAIVGDALYYIGEGAVPGDPPAHFPPELAGNAGPVVIRKAALDP